MRSIGARDCNHRYAGERWRIGGLLCRFRAAVALCDRWQSDVPAPCQTPRCAFLTPPRTEAMRTEVFFIFAVTATGQQPPSVIDAVHKGHAVGQEQAGVEAVRTALSAGGDINERDPSGWTPLMHACLECRPAIAALLLERGADVAAR